MGRIEEDAALAVAGARSHPLGDHAGSESPVGRVILRHVARVAIGLWLGLGPSAGLAQMEPEPRSLSAEEAERVRRGEILVWSDVARKYGESVAVLDGSVGELAEILFDWEGLPDWIPAQSAARILEQKGDSMVVYGESKMPFPFGKRKYRARVATGEATDESGQPIAYLTWRYIPGSGNLKESRGFWYIQPYGDSSERTLARYVAYADPGIWLPSFIIDWATKDVLPKVMKALGERHAELY